MSILLARRGVGSGKPKYYSAWSEVARNRAHNPNGASTVGATPTASLTVSTTTGFAGHALCVRATRNATGSARLGVPATWAVSTQVTFKIQVRTSVALTSVAISLRRGLDDGSGATAVATVTIPLGESEITYTATTPATGPAGAVPSGIAFVWSGGSVGNTFDVTGVQIEYGASVGTFFSGATTNTDLEQFSWVGTANESPSTNETRTLLP